MRVSDLREVTWALDMAPHLPLKFRKLEGLERVLESADYDLTAQTPVRWLHLSIEKSSLTLVPSGRGVGFRARSRCLLQASTVG